MAQKIIANANINMSKINEEKLVEGRNGDKWLNITVFINPEKNQYGYDVDVQQAMKREERANGQKPLYLGNGVVSFKG